MDCAQCRGPNGPALRRKWGCDADLPASPVGEFLDLTHCGLSGREQVRRCPNVTLPPSVWRVLHSYRGWKRGLGFDSGGMGDQSAWWVEAMACIDGILAKQAEGKPSE